MTKTEKQREERIGQTKMNHQGCWMKIVNYVNSADITIEFEDDYKTRINTQYGNFKTGIIKNPSYPSVYNIGRTGNKYPIKINGKQTKEYKLWSNILRRCYSLEYKIKQPTYKDIVCCKEWLYYPNFYDWLISQCNYNKWLNNSQWAIDKDILVKGNKIYSPDTCCLVPPHVNNLFIKGNVIRGKYPIGVSYDKKQGRYEAQCYIGDTTKKIGRYGTPEDAFYAYKEYKEALIKKTAQESYNQNEISLSCYNAMMKYEVEITD